MRGSGGSGWSRITLDPPPPQQPPEKSNLFNLHAVVQLPKICPLANLNTPPPTPRHEKFSGSAHTSNLHIEFNYELVIHVYILFVVHLGCNNRKVIYVIN